MLKTPKPKGIEFHELDSFGCMSGFDFTHGGNAVICFAFPEVHRFLEALIQIEKEAPKPSAEIISALSKATELIGKRHYGRTRFPEYNIEAIVPIAQRAARIEPVLRKVSFSEASGGEHPKRRRSRLSNNYVEPIR